MPLRARTQDEPPTCMRAAGRGGSRLVASVSRRSGWLVNHLPTSGWLSQGLPPPGRRPAAVWLNRVMIPSVGISKSACRPWLAALDEHGSQLRGVDGVGAVTAVRSIGRTGPPRGSSRLTRSPPTSRPPPIEVASGARTRHRLSRQGDRQLNSAIHLVAVTQVRMPNSLGRCYFDKKIAEGKTRNEAMRCLKRRLANHLWHLMIADEQRSVAGVQGQQMRLDTTQRNPGSDGGSSLARWLASVLHLGILLLSAEPRFWHRFLNM